MTTSKHEDHATMVEDCENRESKLTEWEVQFISSISSQLAAGRVLTPKQAEILDTIWDRIT